MEDLGWGSQSQMKCEPPDGFGADILRGHSLPSPWPLSVFPCVRQTDWLKRTNMGSPGTTATTMFPKLHNPKASCFMQPGGGGSEWPSS